LKYSLHNHQVQSPYSPAMQPCSSSASLFILSCWASDSSQCCKLLCSCWMNANSSIKILFGSSFKHQCSKSLGNFSCMRSDIMKSKNSSSLTFVSNKFSITISFSLII
jgi:hypothetical protein